jgi:type IV secretory pathway VirB6-like protein
MGNQILIFIMQQCDTLTATMSPNVDAIGLRMVLSLATIMMVWFGIQEALASSRGGPGFDMAKFLNFFMLLSFAYMFVKYYDSSIPGIGYSLKGFISQGTTNLAQTIGQDGIQSMFQSIDGALAKSGSGMVMFTAPYMLVAYISTQIMLSVLAAIAAVILAYGAVAGTIIGLLGPIFIPFLVIEKLEFLFWGWLKAYLSFAFYKVVAAATMSVLGHLFVTYYANWTDFSNPMTLIKNFPLLILLVVVNIFLILKIPAITASIFSGSSSGHDAGMGAVTGAITAGIMR